MSDNLRHGSATVTLLIAAVFSACSKGENKVLVLDAPWSIQRAEADCDSRSSMGIPLCKASPEELIGGFSGNFSEAFNSDATCNGIVLLTLKSSTNDSKGVYPNGWWLFLELSRGENNLVRYKLTRGRDPDAGYALTGNTDARQAAHDACGYIRGRIGAP